jgi:hypothetical protein
MSTSDILNSTVHEIDWSKIETGLINLRTLRSFRRTGPDKVYNDPYVKEVFNDLLPPSLLAKVLDYHRPQYNEEVFIDNILAFQSKRMKAPPDWESFQNSIDADYHYKFHSRSFDEFNKLETNWQAAAGFGYDNLKKGDPGVRERAYRTASVLALEYRKGTRLTLDQYTPDLALVKPEPSESSKEKLRPVWGVAFHNWILSALGGQPAMKAAPSIHRGYPCIHNIDPLVDIPKYYSYLDNRYPDHHWYQIDWSHLDADVQLFESETYDSRMNERFESDGDELAACSWQYSTDWRSHGTVVAPNGTKYCRNGNVGSGDSLTYHKDSEVSSRRTRYLLKDFEADYCPKELVTLNGGDDGIIGCPANLQLPIRKMEDDALRIFNATLNSKKFEYAYQARDLSLFKIECNPAYHAQRKKDTVSVLGRTLVPLSQPLNGQHSTTRVRMICEVTGWSQPYLNKTYSRLRNKYGEADRSQLPQSWLRSLERAGALKAYKPTEFSKALTSL